jgi:NADH:ubiquinone oxidoreductase subunit 4 (subunit M)
MLLPMYFLISVWETEGIRPQVFLYTLAGSVLC